jgi:hypothetical protein
MTEEKSAFPKAQLIFWFRSFKLPLAVFSLGIIGSAAAFVFDANLFLKVLCIAICLVSGVPPAIWYRLDDTSVKQYFLNIRVRKIILADIREIELVEKRTLITIELTKDTPELECYVYLKNGSRVPCGTNYWINTDRKPLTDILMSRVKVPKDYIIVYKGPNLTTGV